MAAKLDTNRLILRAPRYNDLNAIKEIDIDPAVQKYLFLNAYEAEISSNISVLRKKIKNEIRSGDPPGGSIWTIERKSDGVLIGQISIGLAPSINKMALSFRLSSKYWKFGYATEAVNEVVKHAFNKLGLLELYALIHPDNIGSQSVILKSGFQRDGLLLAGPATANDLLQKIKKEDNCKIVATTFYYIS